MNCVEFGFDRSRGFGSARGQFWPVAIDRPTRPYNIASTTVQQVMNYRLVTSNDKHFSLEFGGKHSSSLWKVLILQTNVLV
jgi:thiamine biosynthesis lipoprotein ApbE